MLGNHGGLAGKLYHRSYQALAEAYPLSTALLRLEAGRVAALRVHLEIATRTLMDAQRQRRDGKGRRPSAREIERFNRRCGLADGSYQKALERLEEMVARTQQPPSIAALVAQRHTPHTQPA
jgi:hypothetical protein